MKRFLPALLLATAAATASATASAQHVGWTEIPRPPLPPGPGLAYLSVIADEIGLTEAQEAEVNQLVDASRLESAVDRERLSQLREQIQELARNDESFDAATAETLAEEMATIGARMAVSGAELRWEIRQVLTPEQRDQMEGWRGGRHRHVRTMDETDIQGP